MRLFAHILLVAGSAILGLGCQKNTESKTSNPQDLDGSVKASQHQDNLLPCAYGEIESEGSCNQVPILQILAQDTADADNNESQFYWVTSIAPVRRQIEANAEVLAEDGACRIYGEFTGYPQKPTHEGYCGDWGELSIDEVSLPYACKDGLGQARSEVKSGLFVPGTSVEVTSSGGSAFSSLDATLPTLARTELHVNGTIARGNTLELSWEIPVTKGWQSVSLFASSNESTVEIYCLLDAGVDSLQVKPSLTQYLPEAIETARVSLHRNAHFEIESSDPKTLTVLQAGSTLIRSL